MKYHIDFDIEFLENKYPGKLIVLEGNEGSGKTTQVQKIVDELNKQGYKTVATKEPTHMVIGEFIRNKVLSGEIKIPRISIQYLYCADRVMDQGLIEGYLKKDYIVISDRYFWSSVAYGIADLGFDGNHLLTALSILSPYHRFLKPDLTFYLDVDMDTAIKRISKSHKHKEIYDNANMFPKIETGYKFLLEKFPEEFTVINGRKTIEKVTGEIIRQVNTKLKITKLQVS